MTAFYQLPSKELVYELINQSNPDLTVPVSDTTVTLGTPVVRTPGEGEIENTRISITAKLSIGAYVGRVDLLYRRINIADLLRGVTVRIKKYSSRQPGSSGSLMFTLYELLADINAQYGLNLSESDFANANITRNSLVNAAGNWTGSANLVIATNNLAYTGQVTVNWESDKQDVSEALSTDVMDGRLWLGGNDFSPERKTQGEYLFYGLDCTPQLTLINSLGHNTAISTAHIPFFDWVNSVTDAALDTTVAHTVNRGIRSAIWQKYTLPNAAVPEANVAKYNRAVLVLSTADSWWQGRMIFHYNA